MRTRKEKGKDRALYEEHVDFRVPEQPNSSPTLQETGSKSSREFAPQMVWTQKYRVRWKTEMEHQPVH